MQGLTKKKLRNIIEWFCFETKLYMFAGETLITEIKIGDKLKIPVSQKFHPEYGHSGKVVWISEDRKTVTIQCEKKHSGKTIAVMVKINSKE